MQNPSWRMRRLAASGLLPERAGQPVKLWGHVCLAELRALDDGSVLETGWVTEMRIRWSARRAEAAAGTGGDGGAWLDGDAARAVACDAAITPVVNGDVNPAVLDDLVALCLQLAGHGPRCQPQQDATPAGDPGPASNPGLTGNPDPAGSGEPPSGLTLLTPISGEAIRQAIIGKAADLLSGPGGLASFLRTRQLGARLAGPSLPLDIGYASTIPAGIRNAVILRDKRCRWAGGCHQPAAACEVHHVRHKANGGHTSTRDCVLLCRFHHQVVIHRWGWTLVLNPDGTTSAWNPDRTKVLHSHSPPARTG
ncbi:MAG TPA: HNH endonuclease signature motif containing protein [Streptosporangiaceae bacterium]|nr:HNH endonuclease signature motif containing protein [Streptosporangiaceae bacterium]